MSGRTKLIYIASSGRSGSTLLECILGAHPVIATTGELHIWPHELLSGGVRKTGSGKMVQEDPFWIRMLEKVNPLEQRAPGIHFFREKHNAGRTLRRSRLPEFGRGPIEEDAASMIDTYGRNSRDVFEAFRETVSEETGVKPEWVVDASKDPYRLLWLLRSGYFDLKVLHIVKNPKSFVYSVTRGYINGKGPRSNGLRLYYTARQALSWRLQNMLISRIAENHLSDQNYQLLRYENLAADPFTAFADVCRMIGCDYVEQAIHDFRFGSPYAVCGNPMRSESRPIELDERWKESLPPTSRWLTHLVTLGSTQTFGYE